MAVTATCTSLLLSACGPEPQASPQAASPSAPETAQAPGLSVGERVGDATLLDAAGREVRLASLLHDGPVVVVFYRGGWCPYCTRALAAWPEHTDELESMGARLIAITPERPEHAAATMDSSARGVTVLSDHRQDAARMFRVVFTMPESDQTRYRGAGIDLSHHNASGTWELPAPGTFVVDSNGIVQFAEADWDYRQRTEPQRVLDAVRGMKTDG